MLLCAKQYMMEKSFLISALFVIFIVRYVKGRVGSVSRPASGRARSGAAWKPEPWLPTGEMCDGNKGLMLLMNPACLSAWFFHEPLLFK